MNRKQMIEMVRKADAERTERKDNRTRLYNIVQAMGNGEAVVWMWAAKTDPAGRLVVRNIQRTRTDADYTMVSGRFMRSTSHNTFVCNWADAPWGRTHTSVWSDVDSGDLDAMWRVPIKFGSHWAQVCGVRFLNGFAGTRYESVEPHLHEQPMSVWFNANEHRWMDIIMCMQMDSRVEFMLKAGLRHLVCPKMVKMLKNPDFFSWFRSHGKEVGGYSADEVILAHARGIPLDSAHDIVDTARNWRGHHVGRFGLTTDMADAYCKRQKITPSQYLNYLRICEDIHRDTNSDAVRFPYHFNRTFDEVDEIHRALLKLRAPAQDAVSTAVADVVRAEKARRRADALCDGMPVKVDGWEIHFLFTKWQRDEESEKMHNCIRTYDDDDRIFTLTKDGVHADAEVDERGDVIQCRLKYNENAPAEVHEVARKVGKLMVGIERNVA